MTTLDGLALLNVRFLVFPQPLPEGQLPPWLKLAHSGAAAVYSNGLSLPRVTVVDQYAILPDTGGVAWIVFMLSIPGTLPASKRVINGPGVPGGMKARARFT